MIPNQMHPIETSLVLGLTAAAANIFGGAIIVQRHWERRYLRYFVALGAGFMLATALIEMVPESIERRGRTGALLVLVGYLIIHFFEHTVTPHFHFGEETHHDEFTHSHRSYSVLLGLIIHTFFDGIAIASGFLVSNWLGMADLPGDLSAQNSRGLHREFGDAGKWTKPRDCLGRVRGLGRLDAGRRLNNGALPPSRRCWIAAGRWRHDLCSRLRSQFPKSTKSRR